MKTIIIYLASLIVLFTSGCINEKIVDVNNLENGSISFTLDKKNIPQDVVKVIVYLAHEGFETKTQSMNLLSSESAYISIENIEVGLWHLVVQALDNGGKIIYFGETDVEVQSNTVVPVNLQLNPTTGAIELIVTWGGNYKWTDYFGNPLVSGSDEYPNAMHSVVFSDKNLYGMYFSGHSGLGADVYLTMSFDGLSWENYGEDPVLRRGETGSWDDRNVGAGPIIKKDNKYFMYYNGRSTAEYVSSAWHIGLAISNNGIEWEKYSTPLISGSINSWDLKIAVSDVKIINGTYYMYYTGKTELNDHRIGLAISSDGINWKKYEGNPIIQPSRNWEGSGIYYASIIKENNKFKMVYQNSYNNYISGFGMAYSTDGIIWTKDSNNPIFTETETKNNCSMILYPNFQKTENEYRIYYTGRNSTTDRYSINLVRKKF